MADVSLKFGVQGDANLKTAIQQVNSEIKNLESEMKLAVAEMEDMDKAEEASKKQADLLKQQFEKNAEKVQLLSQRYETSRDKLKELENKLNEAKETTGENSEEVQKLKEAYEKQKKATTDLGTELNKAKTKMQNAKNEMDSLGNEAKETSENFEKGEKNVGTFGDTLKAKLTSEAIIAAVKKLADNLKEVALGAMNASDELATQSAKTGLSTTALQEYGYMAELIDTPVETITDSMKKLTGKMDDARKGSGDAAEAFDKLGISVEDEEGNLRSNQEVFNEVIDALGKIENVTERDATSMDLFGKSAQELNPLIEAGSEKINAYAQEAHDMGYVMDEDVIARNLEASDAYERMKNSIEGAKNYIGSEFSPVIKKAAEKITEMIQAARDNKDIIEKVGEVVAIAAAGFVAYKVAVEGAAAVSALMAADPLVLLVVGLAGLVTAAALATDRTIELSEETQELIGRIDGCTTELDKNIEMFGKLEEAKAKNISAAESEAAYYEGLAKELETIVDENGKVKDGYEERAKAITGVLSDALNIELELTDGQIKNYKDIRDGIYEVIDAKKAEAIMAAQEEAYTEAVTKRAEAEFKLMQSIDECNVAKERLSEIDGELLPLIEKQNDLNNQSAGGWDAQRQALSDQIQLLMDEKAALSDAVETNEAKMAEYQETVSGYAYNIAQYESNLVKAHEGNYDQMSTITWDLVKAYEGATAEEKAALDAQYGNLMKSAQDQYSAAVGIGTNVINGVKDGVNNWAAQQAAYGAVATFSSNLLNTSRRTLQVYSPSRATAEIGRYLMEGFAVGIDDEEDNVLKQVKDANKSILGAFGGSTTGMTTVNGAPAIQSGNGTYVIQLMLDGKQIATSTTNIQAQHQRAYAL